jgi:hypothetical protein
VAWTCDYYNDSPQPYRRGEHEWGNASIVYWKSQTKANMKLGEQKAFAVVQP